MGLVSSLVALGTALLTTGVAGAQYESQRKEAKAQRDDQEQKQLALAGEADAKMKDEQAQADAQRARSQARSRQRMGQAASQGRAGTILTSPLGVQGQPEAGGKTLLGA